MIRPQKVQARVTHKEKISSGVHLVIFEHVIPDELKFLPGQFLSLRVDSMLYRSYSICSDAAIKKHLSLIISTKHEGVGANYVKNLCIGDPVTFIGPAGRFLLPQNLAEDLVFLATGTGISPFISFLHKLEDIRYTGKIKLYFGVRNEGELFFTDLLIEFTRKLSNFNYEVCYSDQGNRVTNKFNHELNKSAQYFLCGNPNMIDDALIMLLSKEISSENIFYEKFTVTTKQKT